MRKLPIAGLAAAGALTALALFTALSAPARAAGICDALKSDEGSAVNVSGTITDVDPDGAVEIRDECGSILVFAPGGSAEEAMAAVKNCRVGGVAQAIGGASIASVEANALLCE